MMIISKEQSNNIEKFIINNGRKIDVTKWNYLFNGASKEEILKELLKYQNKDGGFGNGLEADILMPDSSSIASTEAILIAYGYGLNCEEAWFKKLLDYFEKTVSDGAGILSFWEKVTSEVEKYPHAPWWNYSLEERFSPNPCAVVASALIKYGSDTQKLLGEKIANRCIEFTKDQELCTDHDCYCLQIMIEVLQEMGSVLIDESLHKHMKRRILSCLCNDSNKWGEYVAQPLDLVVSPNSPWYKLAEPYINENIDYWLKNLKEEGYWKPNFSWGVDTEEAKRVTTYWSAYIAVKRMKILNGFGIVENRNFKLVVPCLNHKDKFFEMMSQWESEGGRINPALLRRHNDGYEKWLEMIKIYKNKDTCPKDRVTSDTYFVTDGDKLIGAVSIRHYLNDDLMLL